MSAAKHKPIFIDGDVPIERGFTREIVVDGLEHPWAMAWLPDGNLLVTERPGRLRRVMISTDGSGQLDPTPLAGLPEVYARGQGGLLDISLDPGYMKNRRIYLSYSHGSRTANRTRVARAVYREGRLDDLEVIFETNVTKFGTQHFGSRFGWLPDGTLLLSVGDGGNPPVRLEGRFIREHAQNLANPLGTIVRINPDGTIPADNPFTDRDGARPEIFSYGHRNIQGLVYDPLRKKIWVTEHGALGGDEFNQPQAGQNFGWPVVTYSREYFDGSKISPDVSQPGMIDPLLVWMTAIAPSGLALYTGDKFPEWKGDLFAGALIKQSVRHIELDADGRITGQREMRFGARVRDVRQGPDGFLYVLTDEGNGQLIRVKPTEGGDTAP
ncbi:MAG: PQQ-dependent sugar dehydrogenase [Desulfobacterales bacterium]|nr:PQQ-dependent sugar dehydrogenase [Desulfobacterales bacterium]MDJ0885417.1 PQQ-dependent sugar dehydrogenase [Desulfobacterales bacterium]MDJ0885817.1 PQQ-dependent sugar dehydrogenase [Desulfobacterales bacterium]MDJ0991530.1 PQQ-dependent sugar dehydrogenase [Desulfobacterales bacterium]